MFTYAIKAGTVDVSVVVRLIDATDGTPETGAAYDTAGIDLQYRREGAASVAITEADLAALTTAHTDGGFKHIGNGYYRLDLPDAACAAGASGVLVHGVITGMVLIGCYIQLVAFDPFDAVRLGLSALPTAAPGATDGLFIAGTNAPTTVTTALTTTFTGNLTGNVGGNVAGSVDSVTGNVGGNVTGSVGSVAGNVTGSVGSVAGNVVGSVGSLATQAKADVNAEVVDCLSTDVYGEPGQEAPGVSVSLAQKIAYLYKAFRNKLTQTSTTLSLYGDDGTTVDQKATCGDDGNTYTRGELGTGP